jgi:transcriptional regulator with XRE-family HTH domain
MVPPLTDADAEKARLYFIGWVQWWKQAHPKEAPTIQALADLLGVSRSAVSLLFNPKEQRAPSFETILAVVRVLGLPFETITRTPPPR